MKNDARYITTSDLGFDLDLDLYFDLHLALEDFLLIHYFFGNNSMTIILRMKKEKIALNYLDCSRKKKKNSIQESSLTH